MIKRKRWSKLDCAELKRKWDENRENHKAHELTAILADEFNCSIGAITWRLAIIEGRARKGAKRTTAHWTPEEIKIIEKFKKTLVGLEITTEKARELNNLLPNRTYTQLKTKIIRMGIVFKRRNIKTDYDNILQEKCLIGSNSIYHRAAKMVGGSYIDGMIIVNKVPLTGKQTLEALARAREII